MRTTMGQRIREARLAKGYDQARLAAKLDIATRTLQRWEKGEQEPDGSVIMRIAKATGVLPQWLLTGEGDRHAGLGSTVIPLTEPRTRRVPTVRLPLLSSVPGGAPVLSFHPDYVDKFVTVDDVRDEQAFALEVKGNSMAPRIEDGDIIVVSPRQEARNGDICVVRVQDEDTVKKVKFEGAFLHLIPLNPEFEPWVVKQKDVTFVWRVVKVIKAV
jgi:repressor LexA